MIFLLITGCLAPPKATPPPTLSPFEVALTPSLNPVREALHACALAQPEIALLVTETPSAFMDIEAAEIALWFGPPPESGERAVPLAEERIVLIVNPGNPVSALSTSSLSAIFSGQIDQWEEVGGEELEIEVWMLPGGDEFTQVFQDGVLENQSFSSLSHLAPDPAAMLEAIREDPAAIGFLPGAWLAESVKPLRLENTTRKAMQQPILALSKREFEGQTRKFVHCLQSGEGHSLLLERYGAWEP